MAAIVIGRNLAADEAVRDRVEKEVIPLAKRMRQDRLTLRETWLRYLRIWSCTRDMEAYEGRMQNYVGLGRRHIENWVRRLKKDFFPNDDWFAIRAKRHVYQPRVAGIKGLLEYFYTKQVQLRRHATPWIRQMVTLGTSPVRVVFRITTEELPVLQEIFDEEGRLTGKWRRREEEVIKFIGPTFTPVDLFAWHLWPVTVADIDDATLVAEEMLVSQQRIRELSEKPLHGGDEDLGTVYDGKQVKRLLDELPEAKNAREKWDAEARRLQDKGFTHPLDERIPMVFRPVDISCMAYVGQLEEDEPPRRYLIDVGCDKYALKIIRDPYLTLAAPWLAGKFVEVEDEYYGRGLPETFDRLQYFLNDISDQSSDALTWSVNPIAVIDQFAVQDPDTLRMEPGAKWYAAINGVKLMNPPTEPVVAGFTAVGQIAGMIEQLAGVSPMQPLGGTPKQRGKTAATSTGAQLLVAEAQVDIKDVVECNEDLVFNRYLRRSWQLAQQCLDRPLVLQITGADGAALEDHVITVADLVGDYEFEWLASTTATNQQVRAMQMTQLFGMALKVPPEAWQADGKRLSVAGFFEDIYTSALGSRNAKNIIVDIQKTTTIDWRLENELFRLHRGLEVVVNQGDNDLEHSEGHYKLLERDEVDDDTKKAVLFHIQLHAASKQAKDQLQQQKAQEQAAQKLLPGPPGAQPGPRGPLLPGGAGGPGRVRSTMGMDDVFRSLPRQQFT